MKRLLLASVAAAGLLVCSVPAQKASANVVTCANCSTFIQDAINFAQEIQNLQSQLQQMQGIYSQLRRALDPNSIAQQLMFQQNVMPGFGQIGSLLQGGAGGGGIGNMARQFLQNDTIYQPNVPDTDYNGVHLNSMGMSLANVQGMAEQALQSIEMHIQGLSQISAQLSGATSEADLSGIQGRLQAEEADITAQGVQAQALATAMQVREQVRNQQDAQKVRQDADELFNNTSPLGGPAPQATGAGGANATYNSVPPFQGS